MTPEERALETLHKERIETYKSLPVLAGIALRTLLLLNGGAAIALLAFLGNVWSKVRPTEQLAPVAVVPIPNIVPAMAFFLGGLVLAGAAVLLAYLTQLRVYADRRDSTATNALSTHVLPLNIAVVICVLSLIAFCIGSLLAVIAFAG